MLIWISFRKVCRIRKRKCAFAIMAESKPRSDRERFTLSAPRALTYLRTKLTVEIVTRCDSLVSRPIGESLILTPKACGTLVLGQGV